MAGHFVSSSCSAYLYLLQPCLQLAQLRLQLCALLLLLLQDISLLQAQCQQPLVWQGLKLPFLQSPSVRGAGEGFRLESLNLQ